MIEIQQPQPYDLVDDIIQVAGQAVTFEANIQYNVTEGHDELNGFFTGGGGVTVLQYQTTIAGIETTAMKNPVIFLTLFEDSPEDGTRVNEVTIPVIYGPFVLENYAGWQPYAVQAGDSLSSIAAHYYGNANAWPTIHIANQHTIPNPNLIFPGQVIRIPIDGGS